MLTWAIPFLYFLLFQMENFYLRGYDSPWLFLGQFENIGLCVLALYLTLLNKTTGKIICGLILTYLFINQCFFIILNQNLGVEDLHSFQLKDASTYFSSVPGAAWAWISLNFLALIAGLLTLQRNLLVEPSKKLWTAFLLIIPFTYLIQYHLFPSLLTTHPLLSLAQSAFSTHPSRHLVLWDPVLSEQAYQTTRDENNLVTLEKTLRLKKKNIIYIILESVGSEQMLKAGRVNAENFPFLSSLNSKTIHFPQLYNTFPGTTRTHISLMTGGIHPTWSSIYELNKYPYSGKTLISELKSRSYFTGLISSMDLDFEKLDLFYRPLGFDHIFNPARTKPKLNPWGVDEAQALKAALEFIKKRPKNKKFYLQFVTNSTHYPYTSPLGKTYHKAQLYTDSIIKKLYSSLKDEGLLDDTIIYMTGDHGESFGEHHKDNITHRNFLYEENIKNFLLIIDESVPGELIFPRLSGVGDIMPTILQSRDSSLLSVNKKEYVQFFHKNTHPVQWGLRSGSFKFISHLSGGHEELYNLELDPHEQNNLAKKFPQKSRHYESLLTPWYSHQNQHYLTFLHHYPEREWTPEHKEAVRHPGPLHVSMGVFCNNNFVAKTSFRATEKLVVSTEGIPYPHEQELIYEIVAPDGYSERARVKHEKDWSISYFTPQWALPFQAGLWRVKIYLNHKLLVENSYTILANGPKACP